MELILASTSTYRRDLLARLAIPFTAVAPGVDEAAVQRAGLAPRGLAEALARAKARAVAAAHPGAVVIGSDQLAAVDGEILGKPGAPEAAEAQLLRLQGRAHELITAVAVCHPGGLLEHTDVTRLVMRPLSREEIRRYVDADRPLDCAGSYKLEAHGITLFSAIESRDHSAVTGLPLIAVTTLLRELGFALPRAAAQPSRPALSGS